MTVAVKHDLLRTSGLKRMVVPGLSLLQGFSLAREVLTTNFFGLGCPFYCGSPSLSLLALTWLIGLLSGATLTVLAWVWLSTAPPSVVASFQAPAPPTAVALRRRLQGYSL